MKAISLVWETHIIKEDIVSVVRHYTKTPIGIVEISIYPETSDVSVDVYDCSNEFNNYIITSLGPWVTRSDFTIGHMKQYVQCLFDSFVYEKLQVV